MIHRAQWCAEAAEGLSETFGHDRELIEAGILGGTLALWRIDGGKSWMVTRVEGGELIVCCYQGERLRDVAPIVMDRAKAAGLHAVRFFTSRPGLARLLQGYGFQPQETVYRCEV